MEAEERAEEERRRREMAEKKKRREPRIKKFVYSDDESFEDDKFDYKLGADLPYEYKKRANKPLTQKEQGKVLDQQLQQKKLQLQAPTNVDIDKYYEDLIQQERGKTKVMMD